MQEEEYKKMGAKIKYYRQLAVISQSKLAENVGISAQYLSRIERGKQMPSVQVLMLIAQNLQVDVGMLVDDMHIR